MRSQKGIVSILTVCERFGVSKFPARAVWTALFCVFLSGVSGHAETLEVSSISFSVNNIRLGMHIDSVKRSLGEAERVTKGRDLQVVYDYPSHKHLRVLVEMERVKAFSADEIEVHFPDSEITLGPSFAEAAYLLGKYASKQIQRLSDAENPSIAYWLVGRYQVTCVTDKDQALFWSVESRTDQISAR